MLISPFFFLSWEDPDTRDGIFQQRGLVVVCSENKCILEVQWDKLDLIIGLLGYSYIFVASRQQTCCELLSPGVF